MNCLEEKKCDICGSNKCNILYKWKKDYYDHNKYATYSWDGNKSIDLTICKCPECGLVYSKPSFKEEYLDLIYPNETIDFNTINIQKLENNNKWDELIEIVEKYIQDKNSSICDIGTRYGVFPKQLKNLGYKNAYGIEFNKESVEVGKRIDSNIFQGTIKDINSNGNFIMDDVLEDLVHPSKDIKHLSTLQNKGELLILRQMNLSSLGYKIYRKNWYYFQPAAHMYYFNEKSIKNLLKKFNYEIIEIKKDSIWKNIRPFIVNFLRKIKIKKTKPWLVNNREMYLSNRYHLRDMFIVVAKKI